MPLPPKPQVFANWARRALPAFHRAVRRASALLLGKLIHLVARHREHSRDHALPGVAKPGQPQPCHWQPTNPQPEVQRSRTHAPLHPAGPPVASAVGRAPIAGPPAVPCRAGNPVRSRVQHRDPDRSALKHAVRHRPRGPPQATRLPSMMWWPLLEQERLRLQVHVCTVSPRPAQGRVVGCKRVGIEDAFERVMLLPSRLGPVSRLAGT